MPIPETVTPTPSTAAPTPVSADADLPTIADRPDADLVIFDGHCRFCLAQVRRLHRMDWRGSLAFISLHDPEVARRYPDLTHDQLMKEMYVIDQAGQRHAGASSIRYLSRRLYPLWPLMPLLHLPGTMPMWRWLYAQIAERRYRLAGRVDTCEDGACSVHFRR